MGRVRRSLESLTGTELYKRLWAVRLFAAREVDEAQSRVLKRVFE